MRAQLTIVGGGLAGLVASISAREAGLDVTLHEARKELGGRARTTPGSHLANWGPHVVYDDGPLWAWLEARGLAEPAGHYPYRGKIDFRVNGRARRMPPARVARALLRLRREQAPVERSFFEWAADLLGDPDSARRIANFMGVATFDHDPGRLSAAFVNGHLIRGTSFPPAVRYIPGGWATITDRLADRARQAGVAIETSSPVDALPPAPVIVATQLDQAAKLLQDPSLDPTGTRTALLDVGLRRRRGDPFVVSDLDAAGWVETFSIPDPTLAPAGEHLVQAQVGLRPQESLDQAIARAEQLLDCGFADWRARETWRRRLKVTDESGALDLPGTTWRDRPRGDRGDGIHVAGDMVAAPGLLSEVSFNSAVEAVARIAGADRFARVA